MSRADEPVAEGAGKTLVLCEPPYLFWDSRMERVRRGEESIPGIGVLVLAALARERGYVVRFVDAKGAGSSPEEVSRKIVDLRPDYLGLSAMTASVTNAGTIAAQVKRSIPHVVTVLGGPHVSAIPERTMEMFPDVDFAIVGEAEHSLFRLFARLEGGQSVEDVPGLAYRRGAKIVVNPRAPYVEDLDGLPPPAWDLVPDFPGRFQPSLFSYPQTPVATVMTSRGCPFSCVFCDRSTSGRKVRLHSVDYVVRMCRRLEDVGVRHVTFVDDLFTLRKERVRDLSLAFLDCGFRFSWSCNSHPNLLDPPTLALMKRSGCWQIAYGIESGSQRVLDVVKGEVSLRRLRETLRVTRAAGIRTRGYVMLGHPTEGLDSLTETARFLKKAELDLLQITKFTPYPGTPAYAAIRQHGSFEEDWERMNAMNFLFVPRGLTEEILESYFDHCYRAFYGRADILWGLVRSMVQQPQFARRLAAAAGIYLRGKFAAGRYLIGRVPARYRLRAAREVQE